MSYAVELQLLGVVRTHGAAFCVCVILLRALPFVHRSALPGVSVLKFSKVSPAPAQAANRASVHACFHRQLYDRDSGSSIARALPDGIAVFVATIEACAESVQTQCVAVCYKMVARCTVAECVTAA